MFSWRFPWEEVSTRQMPVSSSPVKNKIWNLFWLRTLIKVQLKLSHTQSTDHPIFWIFSSSPPVSLSYNFTGFCFKCYLAIKHTKHVNKSWTSRKKRVREGVLFHFKNSSFREKIDWTCGEAFSLPGKQIYCTHSRLKWTWINEVCVGVCARVFHGPVFNGEVEARPRKPRCLLSWGSS